MTTNMTPSITIFLIFLGLLRIDSFPGLETATGTAASVPAVYVLGDSLVDAGNNNYLAISISKANYPHNGVDFPGSIATGRFCNGKNAADAIAEKFGLPLPPPYLSLKGIFKEEERKAAALSGVNFASGGAAIFNGSDQQLRQSIPLSYQVNNWLSIHKELTSQLDPSEAQIHLSKSLFFVVIGSNDIFDYFGSFKLRQKTNPQQYTQSMADKLKEQLKGQAIPLSQQLKHWLSIHKALTRKLGRSKAQIHLSKSLFVMVIGSNDLLNYIRSSQLRRKSSPQQYTQSVVDRFKAQLKTVQETGARRFLILGVAELGCMPSRREKNSTTHECSKEANMLASLYNKALIKMLQQLKEELKSSMAYSYFDMFNSVHDIVSNPTHYGFSDVTSACCGSGVLNAELPCFPVSNLCSDRTKFLFWDRYGHPTEAAARTIVSFVLSEDTQYSAPLTLTQLVSS
ncbi:unnamed protein product [Brassica oleracea var. botrytis]